MKLLPPFAVAGALLALVLFSYYKPAVGGLASGGVVEGPAVAAGPAPAWKLRSIDGREVSSAEFQGKVVLLNFWATWCPPCVAEIPGFVALQKKYQGDLVVVGVSLDQAGVEVVKKFVEANKLNYPVLMGDDVIVSDFGGIEGIPVTFLIDRQGRIRQKKVGMWPEQAIEPLLRPLISAK